VPFLFKAAVDRCAESSTAAAAALASDAAPAAGFEATASLALAAPVGLESAAIALLVGYGLARAAASGFNELRNVVFSTVAHGAIRRISRNVFEQLHAADVQVRWAAWVRWRKACQLR
jgi:hypothetical protein